MIYLFKEVWKYTGEDKGKTVLYFVLHFISLCGELMKPYAFGRFIDALTGMKAQDCDPAIRWLGVYVLGFVIFEIFHRTGQYFVVTTGLRNRHRYLKHMYRLLYHLPIAWHVFHHSGEVVSKINVAGDAVSEFTFENIKFLELVMYSVGPIAILLSISWQAALICVGVTVINNIAIAWLNGKIEAIMQEKMACLHRLNGKMMDLAGNIKTIIILGTGMATEREIDVSYQHYYRESMTEHNTNQPRCFVMSFSRIIAEIMIIGYFLIHTEGVGAAAMLGTLVMTVNYYRQMSDAIFSFMGSIYDNIHWKAALESASSIMLAAEDYGIALKLPALKEAVITESKEVAVMADRIFIRELVFSYGSDGPGIRQIEIDLKKGKKTAVVGLSGCGKSTLMSVLAGLYEPEKACVINDSGTGQGMEVIADNALLAGQTPEIFDNTLRYNLTMGLKADDDELDQLCVMTRLSGILERLPQGYESRLRERGVNLSGGEIQRIALARNLFFANKKQILLLDEITSSVDAYNEQKIFANIFEHYHDRMIVSTIHRLHLLDMFDEVLVMKAGEIIERGTFNELKKEGTHFQKLWHKYISDPNLA